MEKKNLETLPIADEQLDDAVGGTRLNACADARTQDAVEADADDEGEVELLSSPWAVICPNCGHTLRYCKCAR